jgi:hypothetical protein
MRLYAREILTLARQHGGFTANEILDRLYHNMLPEARLDIALEHIRSIEHLIKRVGDWEVAWNRLKEKEAAARAAANTNARSVTFYDPNECCGRCGQRGHHHLDQGHPTLHQSVDRATTVRSPRRHRGRQLPCK